MRLRLGGWAALATALMIAGCKQPAPPPAPAPVAPAPAAPQATEVTNVGATIVLAKDWQQRTGLTLGKLLPDGPRPVLYEKPGPEAPLLLITKVTPAAIGEADPKQYPAAVLGELKKNLAAGSPGLTIGTPGALTTPPPALEAAWELTAEGAFAKLGLVKARARFICGRGADGQVWLLAAFAGDDAGKADIDAMIASLAVAAPAPATPAVPAEAPVAPKADAPKTAPASAAAPKAEAPAKANGAKSP